MGTDSNPKGTDWKPVGTKKKQLGTALERSEWEKLKSRPQMEFCKETRKSFAETKNSLILPIDRIWGFCRIYYHLKSGFTQTNAD
jgi:hypothetical protein